MRLMHRRPTESRIGLVFLLTVCLLLWAVPSLAADAGQAAGDDDSVDEGYTAPHDLTGPAVETLRFRAFDVDRAPLDLQAGEMDLYYYNLKISAARELEEEQIQLFEAPATTISLILNPAPAAEGALNPFSIPDVRRAVQRLVDREFVAREIYQGQAVPMLTNISPTDFDYLTIFRQVNEAGLDHDPESARAEIAAAMTEAGAELKDDIWHFADRPIVLKFIIRVEDERRDVGNLIQTALTGAGFQISPSYQPFAPAIQTVYTSNPTDFRWHLYTEGWGRGAPQRYDYSGINAYYAPWQGNMPGWREVGYWQYEHEELDTLGRRLFQGDFADREARDELYKRMTDLGLEESVRVWIATILNSYPVQADVTGITQDIAAGPRGLWSLRTAYKEGSDELTVGHLWVWTERSTWNPVGGIGDVYTSDIWRQLQDPAMWNHPFSGKPQAFRLDFEIETAGPDDTLEVPADAMHWDAGRQAWVTVPEDTTAVSRIEYDYSRYFQSTFHHGRPISMADVVYSLHQGIDISLNPQKALIETVIATTARPYLETIKGYRVLDENRIETYVDFWHFEEDYIAGYGIPSSVGTPWELLAAMDTLVFEQRRGAYTDTAAARFKVPWISLVLDRDARLVRRVLLDMKRKQTMPESVFELPGRDEPLVDAESALAGYDALLDWFGEKGHLVIGNGPFSLERYDPGAQYAELKAYRAENYPFTPADLYVGLPEFVRITDIEADDLVFGDDYTVSLELEGPGQLAVEYVLKDASSGQVLLSGQAEEQADGSFAIALTADETDALDADLFKLILAAWSDDLARVTERTLEIEADVGFG